MGKPVHAPQLPFHGVRIRGHAGALLSTLYARHLSQGFTGNSFNTIEFFHGMPAMGMRSIVMAFMMFAFVLPLVLMGLAIVGPPASPSPSHGSRSTRAC
ncbi:MAG: hypothetical protein ABIR98_09580 [Usitatibacter sp.]